MAYIKTEWFVDHNTRYAVRYSAQSMVTVEEEEGGGYTINCIHHDTTLVKLVMRSRDLGLIKCFANSFAGTAPTRPIGIDDVKRVEYTYYSSKTSVKYINAWVRSIPQALRVHACIATGLHPPHMFSDGNGVTVKPINGSFIDASGVVVFQGLGGLFVQKSLYAVVDDNSRTVRWVGDPKKYYVVGSSICRDRTYNGISYATRKRAVINAKHALQAWVNRFWVDVKRTANAYHMLDGDEQRAYDSAVAMVASMDYSTLYATPVYPRVKGKKSGGIDYLGVHLQHLGYIAHQSGYIGTRTINGTTLDLLDYIAAVQRQAWRFKEVH